jgi:hypothetical protein
MREETVVVGRADRKTVAKAGERQVEHLATVKRRQRTTIADYCGHAGDPRLSQSGSTPPRTRGDCGAGYAGGETLVESRRSKLAKASSRRANAGKVWLSPVSTNTLQTVVLGRMSAS